MKKDELKMNEPRKNGPEAGAEASELVPEELQKSSGGTVFTAGNYKFNYHIHNQDCCPTCMKKGEFTGNEQEKEYLFGLWSKRQGQFYCNDCNKFWWGFIDK